MSFNDMHRARLLVFQAMYQMHVTGMDDVEALVTQFTLDNQQKKYSWDFFNDMLQNYLVYKAQVDGILNKVLKGKVIADLSPVELSICRLGILELLHRPETPYKVIITESLKIQSKYGTDEGYKLVNAVLDSASHRCR